MLLIVVLTKIFKKLIYQIKITSFHLIQLILVVPPEIQYWSLRKKDTVNSKEISSFQKECRTFIISLVENLFERMLNGISILKNVNHKSSKSCRIWSKKSA